MSKRSDGIDWINEKIGEKEIITSNTKKFEELTNTAHATLVANWKGGGIMTSCNGFVGKYASVLEIKGIKSWFRLEESLRNIGKGHAWVASTQYHLPQKGDILHHAMNGTGLHVDVCLGFDNEEDPRSRKLNRVGAGQTQFKKPRDPAKEFDVLKRIPGTTTYDFRKLLGWLDVEQFFWDAPTASEEPTSDWVIGWWKVYDGNQYYYYFDADGYVQYTKKPPATQFTPPKVPLNSGTYTYRENRKLIIEWNPADGGQTIESFTAQVGLKAMDGWSNRYAPLYANRYSAPWR